MRWISFLSKLAFICNACFLFCFLLRYSNLELNEEVISIIIILGWVMSIAVNLFFFASSTLGKSRGKYSESGVPSWLFLFNLAMLVFEIIYLILNRDMI